MKFRRAMLGLVFSVLAAMLMLGSCNLLNSNEKEEEVIKPEDGTYVGYPLLTAVVSGGKVTRFKITVSYITDGNCTTIVIDESGSWSVDNMRINDMRLSHPDGTMTINGSFSGKKMTGNYSFKTPNGTQLASGSVSGDIGGLENGGAPDRTPPSITESFINGRYAKIKLTCPNPNSSIEYAIDTKDFTSAGKAYTGEFIISRSSTLYAQTRNGNFYSDVVYKAYDFTDATDRPVSGSAWVKTIGFPSTSENGGELKKIPGGFMSGGMTLNESAVILSVGGFVPNQSFRSMYFSYFTRQVGNRIFHLSMDSSGVAHFAVSAFDTDPSGNPTTLVYSRQYGISVKNNYATNCREGAVCDLGGGAIAVALENEKKVGLLELKADGSVSSWHRYGSDGIEFESVALLTKISGGAYSGHYLLVAEGTRGEVVGPRVLTLAVINPNTYAVERASRYATGMTDNSWWHNRYSWFDNKDGTGLLSIDNAGKSCAVLYRVNTADLSCAGKWSFASVDNTHTSLTADGSILVAGSAYRSGNENQDIAVMILDRTTLAPKWARLYGGTMNTDSIGNMGSALACAFSGETESILVSGETFSFGSGWYDTMLMKIPMDGSLAVANDIVNLGQSFTPAAMSAADLPDPAITECKGDLAPCPVASDSSHNVDGTVLIEAMTTTSFLERESVTGYKTAVQYPLE